jgi:hypothetical protein
MLNNKKTAPSFGPDGRRVSSDGPPMRFKCVGRAGSGFSSNPAPSAAGGGGCGGRFAIPSSEQSLFRPGARLRIARAPVMAGLSVSGPSAGLLRKFQRPMTKRRSYDKGADLALKASTLGQKRRFDGMAKLFARAGKGLSYSLPGGKRDGEDGTSDESNSDDDDGENEDDRPFEPLLLWKSPHQGGEAKGLPPRL